MARSRLLPFKFSQYLEGEENLTPWDIAYVEERKPIKGGTSILWGWLFLGRQGERIEEELSVLFLPTSRFRLFTVPDEDEAGPLFDVYYRIEIEVTSLDGRERKLERFFSSYSWKATIEVAREMQKRGWKFSPSSNAR